MTCQEFIEGHKVDPVKCTKEFRLAMLDHYRQCLACRLLHDAAYRAAVSSGSPVSPEDEAEMDALAESDLADPEV